MPSAGTTRSTRHPSLGQRARLVEHDRRHGPCPLEDLRAFDEDAELGAAAGPDHQRGRRREAERARAGDDQHRHGGGERGAGVTGEQEPPCQRGERDREHDGHEDAGDAVGETLHGRLSRLRLGDETGDLRERSVGSDPRRLDDEAAGRVDRRARDLGAGADLHGNGLTGQHREIDGRLAVDDDAVGRDLLTRTDDEAVSHDERLDGDARLDAVAQHACVLGAQLEERPDGIARAPAGARLEEPSQQDQRRDHGADLEVGVRVGSREQDGDGPAEGCERAE